MLIFKGVLFCLHVGSMFHPSENGLLIWGAGGRASSPFHGMQKNGSFCVLR